VRTFSLRTPDGVALLVLGDGPEEAASLGEAEEMVVAESVERVGPAGREATDADEGAVVHLSGDEEGERQVDGPARGQVDPSRAVGKAVLPGTVVLQEAMAKGEVSFQW
jgi:hypothetical protein